MCRVFSCDVMAAMLVSQNKGTAATLVSPNKLYGALCSCKPFLLFRSKNKVTDHVSEHTLYMFCIYNKLHLLSLWVNDVTFPKIQPSAVRSVSFQRQ